MTELELFEAALEQPPADRAPFLDEACAGNQLLHQRLEALLARHEKAASFLEAPAPEILPSPFGRRAGGEGAAATVDQPSRERPGIIIAGRYKLLEQIGEGGMGTVWVAEQTEPVKRRVALKLIKPGMDSRQVIARFEAERQALAMMDHVNIARVLDAGATQSGHPYFVMELVHGVPITKYCDDNHFTPRQRLELFVPVCQAIQHAHQKGVIHRDIKPSNVMVTLYDGQPVAKVIDFGVAKATEQKLTERTLFTQYGTMVGTLEYMSPEQAEMSALGVDTRSDIYSLGVLLYELLTGSTPLSHQRLKEAAYDELLRMIKEEEPPKPSARLSRSGAALASISAQRQMEPAKLTKLLRGELDWIVMKCLEKDRNRRYETANSLAADLQHYLNDEPVQACPPSTWYRFRKFARRNKAVLCAAALIVLIVAASTIGAWKYREARAELAATRQRAENEQWVREQAIPKIQLLLSEKSYRGALELAEKAESLVPGNPLLAERWPRISRIWSVVSDPAGADVYWKSYGAAAGDWSHRGQTPLDHIRLPLGFVHWKLMKDGYVTAEGYGDSKEGVVGVARFHLYKNDSLPADMVPVMANQFRPNLSAIGRLAKIDVPDYFIDKYEVTNRQFKAFVDAGGYQQKAYWKHEMVKGESVLSWEAAMNEFRDASGAAGPAVWQSGTYLAGEADFPVRGVGWYEAAAYAEFADKSLPTITHWVRASGIGQPGNDIISASNLDRNGPAAVGAYQGVGPFGTYDMAGNVKEWCWNKSSGDKRYILGGSWDDPNYMFLHSDVQSAMDRLPTYGFRCVKHPADATPAAVFTDVPPEEWDFRNAVAVSDDQFRFLKTAYAYDKGPLNAEVTSRKEFADHVHETVRFDAAYGTEKVPAHLYLPRNVQPPFQTVIFFPGLAAQTTPYPQQDPPKDIDSFVKRGRAVLCPIYQGTYERSIGSDPRGASRIRELYTQRAKDYFRSIDYVEQRADLDAQKLAYFGRSWGAWIGPVLLALDDRTKVAVLKSGGLSKTSIPEIDLVNFAPRVTVPTLMINGRKDSIFPLATSQRPLFDLLGTPAKDKSHHLVDGDHNIMADGAIEWFDKYLGPVRRETK